MRPHNEGASGKLLQLALHVSHILLSEPALVAAPVLYILSRARCAMHTVNFRVDWKPILTYVPFGC